MTSKSNFLNKRILELEHYVNQLIKIKELFDYEYFREFLLDNESFSIVTENSEIKSQFKKQKGLLKKVINNAKNITSMFN